MNDACLGTTRLKSVPVFTVLAAMVATLAVALLPELARGQDVSQPSALEVMADAVLIDAHCGTIPVNMGALLRYGESHGIAAVDIMPLGGLRKSFEILLARRFESVSQDTLCTSVVSREQDLAPGIISGP